MLRVSAAVARLNSSEPPPSPLTILLSAESAEWSQVSAPPHATATSNPGDKAAAQAQPQRSVLECAASAAPAKPQAASPRCLPLPPPSGAHLRSARGATTTRTDKHHVEEPSSPAPRTAGRAYRQVPARSLRPAQSKETSAQKCDGNSSSSYTNTNIPQPPPPRSHVPQPPERQTGAPAPRMGRIRVVET
ncbi:hypothetical protein CYMTET_11583 [Cymbomonas tetramitiformis]|uniref:Uncharacterized protein n=1 Tax=Cymbomonas tetramitiformis TaxID=36881 RepID=A0AAE0LDB3_9CHLO|nr:hypothetical protein CYMTET_11583 [Cymbomonas tetramitiformis]